MTHQLDESDIQRGARRLFHALAAGVRDIVREADDRVTAATGRGEPFEPAGAAAGSDNAPGVPGPRPAADGRPRGRQRHRSSARACP